MSINPKLSRLTSQFITIMLADIVVVTVSYLTALCVKSNKLMISTREANLNVFSLELIA